MKTLTETVKDVYIIEATMMFSHNLKLMDKLHEALTQLLPHAKITSTTNTLNPATKMVHILLEILDQPDITNHFDAGTMLLTKLQDIDDSEEIETISLYIARGTQN